MKRSSRVGVALALAFAMVVGVVGVSGDANAQQPAPNAEAQELKKKGDELLGEKRFEDALAAYDRSYALSPRPAILYNRARALQFLARYPEALDAIRAFAKNAPPELRAKVEGLDELIVDLESRVATVTFRCAVPGARVMLNTRQIGLCPIAEPIRVNAGPQALEAFADGYQPFRNDLTLPGGQSTEVVVSLVARDSSATLIVKSGVPSSRVSIDGRPFGLAPTEGAVSAGEHEVKVERDGYDEAKTRIVLKAGDRREVSLDPAARAGLLGQWWFWTGVGVIVVGATTTAIALSTERSAPSGSFSPGTVKF